MGKFIQKLSKTFLLANYKAYRVDFPQVKTMTANITRNSSPDVMGIRHFNRDLVPAIRLANNDLIYNMQTTRQNAAITKPTIEIEFVDGTKTVYDAAGKDSVQIYYDLIHVARGNNFMQRRRLQPHDMSDKKPILTVVE